MTTVLPAFRHQTAQQALQLLQSSGSGGVDTTGDLSGGGSGLIAGNSVQKSAMARISELLLSVRIADGPSLRDRSDAQQNAIERISKLLLGGAGSSDGFLVVMPAKAKLVEGGSGADTVTIAASGDGLQPNYVSLGDGNDRLNISSTGDATADYWQGSTVSGAAIGPATVNGKEIAVVIPSGQGIFAGAGNDVVTISAGRDVYHVSGNEGDDALTIAAGRDISGIWGGAGNDALTLASGASIDNITGDNGDDVITAAAGKEARSISGGQGRDILTISAGETVSDISGGSGSDIINVASGGGAYYVLGGEGNDAISVVATEVNHVEGGTGDDTIKINASTAKGISGGRGDDRIDLTGTDTASMFFDRGDGKDVVSVGGETTIVFAERSINDATISYGDGTITVSFADNGDSVTLDYSGARLKGSQPALTAATTGTTEIRRVAPAGMGASSLYAYFDSHNAGGFSLTLS
ncbi:MAG: hypothetical protein AB1440_08825 [Pseudomonadota bacterium]